MCTFSNWTMFADFVKIKYICNLNLKPRQLHFSKWSQDFKKAIYTSKLSTLEKSKELYEKCSLNKTVRRFLELDTTKVWIS